MSTSIDKYSLMWFRCPREVESVHLTVAQMSTFRLSNDLTFENFESTETVRCSECRVVTLGHRNVLISLSLQ